MTAPAKSTNETYSRSNLQGESSRTGFVTALLNQPLKRYVNAKHYCNSLKFSHQCLLEINMENYLSSNKSLNRIVNE